MIEMSNVIRGEIEKDKSVRWVLEINKCSKIITTAIL